MKNLLFAVAVMALAMTLTGCDSQMGTSLFDGKTLDGWTQKGGKATYDIEPGGIIVGTTVPNTGNSFLCTEKHYSDFVLEYDFKVDPRLNSGVQIRSNSLPDYNKGRVHGYQIEIDPSTKPYTRKPVNLMADGSPAPEGTPRSWTAGIYDEGRRGWLNNLTKKPVARAAFKPEQWNHICVEAIGDSIKTFINGVPAADLTDSMTPSGFIALQVHGVGGLKEPLQIRWRNIKIQDLSIN
ncbi:MAG: DUF1080 domain-containing protein [Anaerohalosphaera sp.]|nr:DUF1080 domain-containing protein [Anaerohalosphaera sp.]